MCPVDERDEGIARLADWAVEHALGMAVAPPRVGRLPAPDRAGQDALQLAERVHRRLVAWRWMALRFPDTYRDIDGALAESRYLNEWIEAVLSAQPSGRTRSVAGGAEMTRGRGFGPGRQVGAASGKSPGRRGRGRAS
jgi:ATP-dependent RNA helicase SUPV3L1/SUV3